MHRAHSDRFLLLIFQVHSVLKFRIARDIKIQLKNLPKTPEAAYQELLERMTPEGKALAIQILGWVLNAQRILKMSELQEVLALRDDQDCPSLDTDDCPVPDSLIQTCGGLVAHDRDSDLITFSHETVRPFLEFHAPTSLPSHQVLCRTCLTYLQLREFENPCDQEDWRKRKEEFKFSDYAAAFWATHANQLSERELKLEEEICETFRPDGRRKAMAQLRSEYYAQQKSLLHVLIENGLSRMFISPLPDGQSMDRMYASFYHSRLMLSLSELVFPNWAIIARDGYDQTPLHYAAINGEVQVVQWLVEKDAEVDPKTKGQGQTPLSYAAENGHLEVVKFLVQEVQPKAEVDLMDHNRWTPLSCAAVYGHLEVVKFLVQEAQPKPEVDSKDNWGQTPLSRAARNGQPEVVKFLVQEAQPKAEVDSKDIWQRTPLGWAAENGHLEVVKLLVQEAQPKAEVDSKPRNWGRTPLSLAAENGHLEVVKILVQEAQPKAEVDSKDPNWPGRTPLSLAAENGHLEVVKFLVQEAQPKAEVDSKDPNWPGRTPLSLAAERDHLEVVKFLVQEAQPKAEVDSKDDDGQTPLSLAAMNGCLEVVKFLVQEAQPKADIGSKNNAGKTALDLAMAAVDEERGKQFWETKEEWEFRRERRRERGRAVVAVLEEDLKKQKAA